VTFGLARGATVFADKGYISEPDAYPIEADNGVRLVSAYRRNMPLVRGPTD